MHAINFVDGVLELEPQGNLLIEGLISLLEILYKYFSLIGQVEIFIFKSFEFLVHGHVFLLIEFLIFLNNLLSSLNFHFQLFHFPQLIPLNFSHHSLIIASRTVLKQQRINFPNVFDQLAIALTDLLDQVVKTD